MRVELPEFPDLSRERLDAVLSRNGLSGVPVVRLPEIGIFNAIFTVGEALVLRIPRQHPAFIEAAGKEALVVPVARDAGVRTPALLVFDDTLEVLPVPYSLYERVNGETLEPLQLAPGKTPNVYRELGRDLARLHAGVDPAGPIADLTLESLPGPDGWPEELAEEGHLGVSESRWLSGWLERLRQRVDGASPSGDVLRHGDVQASNVMVSGFVDYVALLDWGACGWGSSAHDFAGVPFDAVPFMLEGYREMKPLPRDGSFEAQIVLRQLHIALFLLRRPPQPGRSWAERPLGMLLDLMRFLGQTPDEAFSDLRP